MSALTAALYGALALYLGGWFLGFWVGNFALLLFLLSVVTGAYWLAERLHFLPARQAAAAALVAQQAARRAELTKLGISKVDDDVGDARERLLMQPWWLDWTAGLFPVIVGVFVLRSFLFEPFKIPSGSMVPTLLVGDLILVNKFEYGVRLPVLNKKVVANADPQRGDVVVFRYPPDPRLDYIKRVVGVPGDEIVYQNQKLALNGRPVPMQSLGEFY
ncbi:MAG: signal peptidase I, partial [Rubrivivax sp.]